MVAEMQVRPNGSATAALRTVPESAAGTGCDGASGLQGFEGER
jgi:hypothetical protein